MHWNVLKWQLAYYATNAKWKRCACVHACVSLCWGKRNARKNIYKSVAIALAFNSFIHLFVCCCCCCFLLSLSKLVQKSIFIMDLCTFNSMNMPIKKSRNEMKFKINCYLLLYSYTFDMVVWIRHISSDACVSLRFVQSDWSAFQLSNLFLFSKFETVLNFKVNIILTEMNCLDEQTWNV